eukprot:GHVS01102466.1.p1 GENE.GHVS01102466.1~~GHVS01102466.1.p1  ORF type:complete len:327 (+),score=49.78 GHVS01102466.1:297-1277(+)
MGVCQIFNSWHYIEIAYNPTGVELKPLYKLIPLPNTGAVWAIETFLKSLAPVDDDVEQILSTPNPSVIQPLTHSVPPTPLSTPHRQLSSTYGTMSCPSPPPPHAVVSSDTKVDTKPWWSADLNRANRHVAGGRGGGGDSSGLSANLQLRLLIHIMGDIHQPMHCVETFMTHLPDGDRGGTKIKVDNTCVAPSVTSLHALWDSVGDLFNQVWPSFTSHHAMKQATSLVSSYPRESFGSRLRGGLDGSDLNEVVKDSHRVAVEYAYEEISFSSYSASMPFCPSSCYIERLRILAQQQITLGGYRLSTLLKRIAADLIKQRTTGLQGQD